MKKTLFLLQNIPFPINFGARVRTASFIKALKQAGDELYLLCPKKDYTSEQLAEAREYFYEIFMVDIGVPVKTNKIDGLINVLKGEPWEISANFKKELNDKFLELLGRYDPDAVFCRYIVLAKYFIQNRSAIRGRTIVDLDDIETLKNKRIIARQEKKFSYPYLRKMFNNWLLDKYHQKLNCVDASTVCSDQDREYVLSKKWCKNVSVIPNSIDTEKISAVERYSEDVFNKKILMTCGHLAYGPNYEGLLWFLKEVWPILNQKDPDVRFHMVGLNPHENLLKFVDHTSVFLFPNVPSVVPFYNEASAFIVPLHDGGGTRVKILEAFTCNRPVISTTVGAEGLEVERDRHCIIADNPEEFAEGCLSLLTNYEKSLSLADEGLKLLQEQYSLHSVENQIQELFAENIK